MQKQIDSLSTRVSAELNKEDGVVSPVLVALGSAPAALSNFPSPKDLF